MPNIQNENEKSKLENQGLLKYQYFREVMLLSRGKNIRMTRIFTNFPALFSDRFCTEKSAGKFDLSSKIVFTLAFYRKYFICENQLRHATKHWKSKTIYLSSPRITFVDTRLSLTYFLVQLFLVPCYINLTETYLAGARTKLKKN